MTNEAEDKEADGKRKLFRTKTDNFSQAVDCQDEEQDPGSRNCPSSVSRARRRAVPVAACSPGGK